MISRHRANAGAAARAAQGSRGPARSGASPRLGRSARRGRTPTGVDDYAPPGARAAFDALVAREGGLYRLLKERIGELRPDADATLFESDAFGCALGATAIVMGVALDTVLGGIAAVGGILVMADAC
jgi:hypothetical protein